MTVNKAAEIIGCSVRHVRTLIKLQKIAATRDWIEGEGPRWDISLREAERFRDTKQSRGYPRGKPRTKKDT